MSLRIDHREKTDQEKRDQQKRIARVAILALIATYAQEARILVSRVRQMRHLLKVYPCWASAYATKIKEATARMKEIAREVRALRSLEDG